MRFGPFWSGLPRFSARLRLNSPRESFSPLTGKGLRLQLQLQFLLKLLRFGEIWPDERLAGFLGFDEKVLESVRKR